MIIAKILCVYDSVKLLSDPSLVQNLLEVRSKCLYWVRGGLGGVSQSGRFAVLQKVK